MELKFSKDEIQEFKQYACDTIEEYYPLLKKAVSPRAAAKMKKSMLYITVKMYPCSGGTDTGSPEL